MTYRFIKILVASLFILSCGQKQKSSVLNETDSLRPKNMAYLQTLITFHNTSWTYGASFIIDKTKRELTFLRYQDDYGGDAYSKVRYSCDDYGSKT